jgi:hypothetical protein
MQRVQRNITDTVHDRSPHHTPLQKSPLRRQNGHQANPARSPIRSRTPTRHVSPLKTAAPFPSSIRFISTLSPAKERPKGNL